MKRILLGVAAAAALSLPAAAQSSRPLHVLVGPPAGLTADEIRDYELDQLEKRHEMEQRRLELRQTAERRFIDPEED